MLYGIEPAMVRNIGHTENLAKIINNLISKIHNIFTTHFTKGCLIYPLITADGGVADVLQHVQINVLTNSDCSWRWLFQSILSTHICVGGGTESACNVSTLYIILLIFDRELMFKICFKVIYFFLIFYFVCLGIKGDSGGPLVCQKNGEWVLAGVTSWGSSNCQNMPNVYTRVSKYLSWMDTKMANWTNGSHSKKYLCHILK